MSCNYPEKTKEEYITEIQEVLSELETYKVRYFYIFTMAKLGLILCKEGDAIVGKERHEE